LIAIRASIGAVSATRPAACAALQQVRSREDHVGAIEIIVFRIELSRGGWRRRRVVPIHFCIVSNSIWCRMACAHDLNQKLTFRIEP
jgi:hypothetical protein